MNSYMESFKTAPLARSRVESPELAQMQRPAGPAPLPPQQQSMTQQAMDMAKQSVMQKGMNMAMAPVEGAMQTGFNNMLSGITGAFAAPTIGGTATPLMKAGVDVGLANAMGAKAAAGGAAGAGGMAALGAAAPWLVGGLMAGKAFGLFNRGGQVGHHIGGMVNMPGPLSGIRYKYDGGEIKEEIKMDFKGPLSR